MNQTRLGIGTAALVLTAAAFAQAPLGTNFTYQGQLVSKDSRQQRPAEPRGDAAMKRAKATCGDWFVALSDL